MSFNQFMLVASFALAMIGLQVLTKALILSIRDAKNYDYTINGQSVQSTWRDFPEFLDDQIPRLFAAILLICASVALSAAAFLLK